MLPMGMQAQYTIYPVPHVQTAGTGKVDFTPQVNVICEGVDRVTQDRVRQVLTEHGLEPQFAEAASPSLSNLYIGVRRGEGAVNQKAAQLGLDFGVFALNNKYDRHLLSLSDGGEGRADLLILGEHSDAAFYGLASLEQIFDQGTTQLDCVTISDYADQKERGVIEGFYGLPYSLDARKELFRYMARYKMNTYMYGPKTDVYHSGQWRDPYPVSVTEQQEASGYMTQDKMRELATTATENKVNLIWAIHPGNALMYNDNAVSDIMTKFTSMYSLGFRQFAVFCDDVAVPNDDATMKVTADRITDIQHQIEQKWNVTYNEAADTVRSLQFVPQIYCRSFAGSEDQFNRFFRALSAIPENVTVYQTGWGVWSVPNDGDFNLFKEQFGREVAWWWNYPCNDNGSGPNEVYPLDMYSNFFDMPNVNSSARLPQEITASSQGIVCNPMEQPIVSKTALFSAGDFGWNNRGFDNLQSWEASFKSLFPGNPRAAESYRFLAPYLSKNEPESLNSAINTYKIRKDPAPLQELLGRIAEECSYMLGLESSSVDGERLLIQDLKPWLNRLKDMADVTSQLLTIRASEADLDELWPTFVAQNKAADELSTAERYMAYHFSGFGSSGISKQPRLAHASYRYLTPFVEYMQQNAIKDKYTAPKAQTRAEGITNVADGKVAAAGAGTQPTIVIRTATTLNQGDYVGLKLVEPSYLKSLEVDDTLQQNYTVMVSADGKQWDKVTDFETAPKGYVRYTVLLNEGAEPRSIVLKTGQFRANLLTAPKVETTTIPEAELYENHGASYMTDGKYDTYTCIKRDQKVGDAYIVKLKEATPINRVRICMGTTNGDYMAEGRVQLSEDGQKWTDMTIAGTIDVVYTLAKKQNMDIAPEVKACDFDGRGKTAQYVRLYVTKIQSAPKWLRLYEIEVNGDLKQPRMEDKYGMEQDNATDGNLSTSTAGASNSGEFVYHLSDFAMLDGLKIYADPTTLDNASFSVSNDGKEWQSVTAETATGVLQFTMDEATRNAVAFKVTWTGETVPVLYEILEQTDASALPPVTSIDRIETGSAAGQSALVLRDGRLVVESAAGLRTVEVYDMQGRKVMSYRAEGTHSATVPMVGLKGGAAVVKVTLADGTQQSAKVVMK